MGTLVTPRKPSWGTSSCPMPGEGSDRKGHPVIESLPTPVFWIIVVVLIIAIIAIIAVPMYKGYKKEMEKPVKKSGSKSGTKKK